MKRDRRRSLVPLEIAWWPRTQSSNQYVKHNSTDHAEDEEQDDNEEENSPTGRIVDGSAIRASGMFLSSSSSSAARSSPHKQRSLSVPLVKFKFCLADTDTEPSITSKSSTTTTSSSNGGRDVSRLPPNYLDCSISSSYNNNSNNNNNNNTVATSCDLIVNVDDDDHDHDNDHDQDNDNKAQPTVNQSAAYHTPQSVGSDEDRPHVRSQGSQTEVIISLADLFAPTYDEKCPSEDESSTTHTAESLRMIGGRRLSTLAKKPNRMPRYQRKLVSWGFSTMFAAHILHPFRAFSRYPGFSRDELLALQCVLYIWTFVAVVVGALTILPYCFR